MTGQHITRSEKCALGAIMTLFGAGTLLVIAAFGYLGYTFYAGHITGKAVKASSYYQDCVADISDRTYPRVNQITITEICSHATLGNWERMRYNRVNTIKNGLIDPADGKYLEAKYFNQRYRQIGPQFGKRPFCYGTDSNANAIPTILAKGMATTIESQAKPELDFSWPEEDWFDDPDRFDEADLPPTQNDPHKYFLLTFKTHRSGAGNKSLFSQPFSIWRPNTNQENTLTVTVYYATVLPWFPPDFNRRLHLPRRYDRYQEEAHSLFALTFDLKVEHGDHPNGYKLIGLVPDSAHIYFWASPIIPDDLRKQLIPLDLPTDS